MLWWRLLLVCSDLSEEVQDDATKTRYYMTIFLSFTRNVTFTGKWAHSACISNYCLSPATSTLPRLSTRASAAQ